MKKMTILLLLVLTAGCSAVRIDTSSIDNTLNVVLSKNNNLYNRIGKGYKYYIPRGVTYMDTDDLNDKLYSNGINYYLYIDVISYYNRVKTNYKENKNAYYSKKIEGKKDGYLDINKVKGKYKIEFVYNYAKIEALVEKEEIEDVVLNASYILSTVKFNDNIIKIMLNEEYFTNKEETYDVFSSKTSDTNFLGYQEEK